MRPCANHRAEFTEHEAAEISSIGDIGGSFCDACRRANTGAGARRRIDSGFLPLLATPVASWPGALGIGSDLADQQVAAQWRERLQPAGRRLHQSHSEA